MFPQSVFPESVFPPAVFPNLPPPSLGANVFPRNLYPDKVFPEEIFPGLTTFIPPNEGTGLAFGTSTAVGSGAAIVEADSLATGTSSATGQSDAASEAVGTAAGTSTATGVSGSATEAVGNAAGVATATAQSGLISPAAGSADGIATASATGEVAPFWQAVGSSAGLATALGAGDFILPPEPPDTIQRIPPVIRPAIPQPSDEYDPRWASLLVQALEVALEQLEDYRLVRMTGAELNNFPRNGAGLNPGEVFINENGVLQVVRPGDIFVGNAALVTELGSVTVVTP